MMHEEQAVWMDGENGRGIASHLIFYNSVLLYLTRAAFASDTEEIEKFVKKPPFHSKVINLA